MECYFAPPISKPIDWKQITFPCLKPVDHAGCFSFYWVCVCRERVDVKRIGEYKEKHRDERLEHCRERVSGLSGGHHTNVRETGRFKCVCLARVSWRERCRVSRMELVKDAGLYWNPSERLLEWREKQYFFLFSFFSSNLPSLPPLFGWNAGGRDRHWFSRERCLALVLFF